MTDLKTLCENRTLLAASEIERLENLAVQLPLIAELTNADVFLDCLDKDGNAIVVAEAFPQNGESAYAESVIGELAAPENEPAVFSAFKVGTAICDLKAITQEGRSVRQNVAPVKNEDGRIIAVLIREKDITGELIRDKKFEQLAEEHEQNADPALRRDVLSNESAVIVKEIHHRVKNNLQLVASILNLQARKQTDDSVKRLLLENVDRIQSMAAIHELLNNSSSVLESISSGVLLNRLAADLALLIPADKNITIECSGDDIVVGADTATSVAMVVNELVLNALKHAFAERREGKINLAVSSGIMYHTITVSDNGIGFNPSEIAPDSLGYSIIKATVESKLNGKLRINSDSQGTKVSFDFK